MKQRLTILGSTGSIGTNTLDVVARHPDRFEVFALSAATQVDRMLSQCAQFKPRYAVMASEAHGRALQEKTKSNGLEVQVLWTSDAIEMIASHPAVDAVMAAIVGAAGLASCIAAARAGKRLLLANKEALVVGGQVFLDAVREGGATLLPIDSEHSAIFQCLPTDRSTWAAQVDRSSCSPLQAARSVSETRRRCRRSRPTRPAPTRTSPWAERFRSTRPP